MKTLNILILGLFLISFTSASFYDRVQSIQISNNNTNSEELSLSINNGEIRTYLTRYSPLLDTWIRARGTFYNIYDDKIKFGLIDREILDNRYSIYKYYFVSTMSTYEKEGYYYFYDGNLNNKDGFIWVDLSSICSKENANCNITRYTKNRFILKDLNIISVEFNSTRDIDPDFAGGNGTSINPYQITNWTNLNQIRECLTCYYVLNNNLDSSMSDYSGIGDNWQIVGNTSSTNEFNGVIDGQGYNISNLIINPNGILAVGFIGYGGSTSKIKNLGFKLANVTGARRTGAFVGTANTFISNSFCEDCNVTGTGGSTSGATGGLVGYHGGLQVVNYSYYTGLVYHTAGSYTGGLIGQTGGSSAIVNNSYFEGIVTTGAYGGGIVGYAISPVYNSYTKGFINCGTNNYCGGITSYNTQSIRDSYFIGNVTGFRYVAGITGYKTTTGATAMINNTWSTGIINGASDVSGIAGLCSASWINNSWSNATIFGSESRGQTSVGGLIGELVGTGGILQNSHYEGFVRGYTYVGGLVGTTYSGNGQIINSYFNGTLNATFDYCGGIVGYGNVGRINNSYAMGNITKIGTDYCGGLVGRLNNMNITNSYSTIKLVAGKSYSGGLVGFIGNTTPIFINNSYWDINVSGYTYSAGGTGYTTEQMKNGYNFNGWNILQYNDSLINDGYPFLAWQINNKSSIWLVYNISVPPAPEFCWIKQGGALIMPFSSCGIDGIMDISKILKEAFG